ncbi:hypothetical protein GCM10027065_18630 [Rhodanobacter koreensis]
MTLLEEVTEGVDIIIISVGADTECAEHGSDGYGDEFVAHDGRLRVWDKNVVLRRLTCGCYEPSDEPAAPYLY